MKINSSTSHKKRTIAVLVSILLVSGVALVLFLIYRPVTTPEASHADDSSVNYQPATDEEIAEGNAAKEETIKADEAADTPAKSISQQITTTSVSGGTLYVRNEISDVHSTGSCTLTLSQGSRSVVKKSGVQALASTSTCKGFNVPVAELSKGTWSVILTVTIGDKTADDTAEVQI